MTTEHANELRGKLNLFSLMTDRLKKLDEVVQLIKHDDEPAEYLKTMTVEVDVRFAGRGKVTVQLPAEAFYEFIARQRDATVIARDAI